MRVSTISRLKSFRGQTKVTSRPRLLQASILRAGLVLALAAALAGSQATAAPRLQKLAPPLKVTAADGRAIDLSAMRGKVVLVSFWATWCGICLAELPAIGEFYRKHHAEGFEVIALSIDEPRDRQRMMRLLAKLPFPGALVSEASQNGFGTTDWVPISYVVDAQGVVRQKFSALDERALNKEIAPLLKEVPRPPVAPEASQ